MAKASQSQIDPELPDQVDAALEDLWRGSSGRLERLLETESSTGIGVGEVMEGLAGGLDRVLPQLAPGTEINGLRIVRELGRGGMGVVYAAEQQQSRSTVALKVLRPGLTSDSALRRFEYEARLLARLRHPGIAQIYETGMAETPEGTQPYLVMELVSGRPLIEFAKHHELDTTAKLGLFLQVCDAVQHAHQRGVIHRDLKPANILVSASGQPKVLDFGVGRPVDVETLSMHTSTGQLVGTLPYMSPEQVRGHPDELDTRSDVYTLGVLLHELLSGRLPHDIRRLSLPEAACRIRDEEPPALSTYGGEYRGDLDTIVAKAIARDRERRYQSAGALREDIGRYLRGETIEAKRDSALYVLCKTAARYRWPLIAFGALILLLSVFAIHALGQAQKYRDLASRERQASQSASAARRNADLQRQQAERHADRADAVRSFLQMMLVAADPTQAETRDVTIREVLDDAARRIESGTLADQPGPEMEVRQTIARTYRHLGLYHSATPHFEWVHEFHVRGFGESAHETLCTLSELAQNYTQAEQYQIAKTTFERCLELVVAANIDDPGLTLATMDGLGSVLIYMGEAEEAESLHLDVLQGVEQAFGREHELAVNTTFNLGKVYGNQGRLEDAEGHYVRALELSRRLYGEKSYVTIRIRRCLAYDIYRRTGRMPQAEQSLRETLELARHELGDQHTETNIILVGLSRVLRAEDRIEEAEQLLRDAITGFKEIRGIENNDTLKVVGELAHLLAARRKHDEAARVLANGIEQAIAIHGDEYAQLADWVYAHARILAGTGDYTAAVATAERALDIHKRVLGAESSAVANTMQGVGWFCQCAGDYSEAAEWYRRTLALQRRISGDTHPETTRSAITLAYAMVFAGEDLQAAAEQLHDQYNLVRAELGDAHPQTQWIARYLAHTFSFAEQHAEALALDRALLDIAIAEHGADTLAAATGWRWLGQHLHSSGRPTEAIASSRRAVSIYRAHEKQETVAALQTQRELAEMLIAVGEPEEAEALARGTLSAFRAMDGGDVATLWTTIVLGEALVAGERLAEAEPLLHEAIAQVDASTMRVTYAATLGGQARSALGQCLLVQGRHEKAEPLLLEAHNMLPTTRKLQIEETRSRLVALYEAWNKPAEAARWRAHLSDTHLTE